MADRGQQPLEREVQVDPDAVMRATIFDLFAMVQEAHGGQKLRRLELEQRADHVAVYATFLSHLRDPGT
jgi:hypothetical protein